jgi:glutamyl/glutaminyl-tRNA synthetase
MKAGKFGDGEKVLRAKIDMAHANLNMRDPVMYRIRHMHHQRTGDRWCIYPMYDWAHGQSDSIEGITHSLCTLEFEHHRPLYDWFCDALGIYKPQQIEFARLNVEYMLTSKRKLLQLVEGGHVDGWDDPRCRRCAACAAAVCRPRRWSRSASTSAWRSSTARTRSACSSSSCATGSTSTPCAAWRCSTRSSW